MQPTSLRVGPTASSPRHRVKSEATGCNAIFVIFLCMVGFALVLIHQSMTRSIFFPQSPLDGEDLQQPWSIKIVNTSKSTNNLDGLTNNPMEIATLATPSTAGMGRWKCQNLATTTLRLLATGGCWGAEGRRHGPALSAQPTARV